jgi:hypothetical protein
VVESFTAHSFRTERAFAIEKGGQYNRGRQPAMLLLLLDSTSKLKTAPITRRRFPLNQPKNH